MTYERDPVIQTLRARAREAFRELHDGLLREYARTLPLDQALELSLPALKLKRLLCDTEPPPAEPVPANIRRLVAAGRVGGEQRFVVGPGGLRAPPRPVAHVGPCDPAVCGRPHGEELKP